MATYDYDVLVVGSGFGGSVSALRLTEKGYRVGVIEAGRRFSTTTLPKTSWQLRKFLWAPGPRHAGHPADHPAEGHRHAVGRGSVKLLQRIPEPARRWRCATAGSRTCWH